MMFKTSAVKSNVVYRVKVFVIPNHLSAFVAEVHTAGVHGSTMTQCPV